MTDLILCVHADEETDDYNSRWTGEEIDSGVGKANSEIGIAFTPATQRTNISSMDVLTTILGKVSKWFTDIGAHLSDSSAHVSSSDRTNWDSKTSNIGTITGITMNGQSKGNSGEVNLGTVLTDGSDFAPASHTSDTQNPHSVTKTQVGLGNVPNVSTNDQTPTWTIASALADLVSGETLSIAFGKLAKAVSSLISHIGDTTSHVSSSDRTNWNSKTSNVGTITSVKMNGTTVSSSGEADLGTVLTAHQDISGKAPNNHASTASTYGLGNSSYYGHLKLSDSTSSTSSTGGGVAATPAAVKAAYDASSGKATKATYTATLSSSSWATWSSTGKSQSITVSGILATDTPVIGIVQTGTLSTDKAMLEAWALVGRITTAANQITAYCYGDAPSVNLPLQIMCMR